MNIMTFVTIINMSLKDTVVIFIGMLNQPTFQFTDTYDHTTATEEPFSFRSEEISQFENYSASMITHI